MKKVAVIGGGLGGLSAAITLANAGMDVTVFEKNKELGGKMRSIDLGTHHFDFGPNTITMRPVFQQVLAQTGVDPDDYLNFIPLRVHMKNVSSKGEVLYFSNDQQYMIEQIKKISLSDAKNYPAFITEISRIYFLAQRHFLQTTFTSWRDYMKPSLLSALVKVRPFETLDQFIRKYFQHPFIVQCFLRYATYIGSSPYIMPATFAMIAYLELVDGVDYVEGGTSKIAQAFTTRAKQLGVKFHVGCEVTKVKYGKTQIHSIIDQYGNTHTVDAVFMNSDRLSDLFELDQVKKDIQPSSSAFVILLGLNKRIEGLHHHNVYFPENYELEFDALFSDHYVEDPTIYICNSSYTDRSISPSGDNLLILVNAPPTKKGTLQIDSHQYRQKIIIQLKELGLDIEDAIVEGKVITPEYLEKEFYAFRGALYGAASNSVKSAFFRPSNRHAKLKNLYFVGGTVHPGGGSPLVTLGGMNVAKKYIAEKGQEN